MSDDRRPTTDETADKETRRQGDKETSTSPGLPVSRSPGPPVSSVVELHIDELVLHGFVPGDRYAIAAAVERELARLLGERGAPPGWAQGLETARLDAGTFDVAPGASVDAIGAQAAGAVYGGLSTAR